MGRPIRASIIAVSVAVGIAVGTALWMISGDGPLRYLIATNAFLTACIVSLALAYSDARRKLARATGLLGGQTVRLLEHLDYISQLRTSLSFFSLRHESDPSRYEERAAQTSALLLFLADEARFLFEDYVKKPCAVSIKLLVPDEDMRPMVNTYLRDGKSKLSRKDEVYPFTAHSPFVELVSGKIQEDYYINNDLKAAARRGEYLNARPDWSRDYNATLIMPIKDPGDSASQNVVGFLCIDSLTGRFDDAACVHMARIVANCIFLSVVELSLFRSKQQTSPEAATNDARSKASTRRKSR